MSDLKSPEILDYRNANGHGWTFYKCDGILRSLASEKTPEEDMKDICYVQDLELRDDDVIIVAYPKCGTHWLWEIVAMIQSGQAEYSTNIKEIAMLGMKKYEKADELPSPRVLNSHYYFRHLPGKLVEKRIKTIHIMRNPKDASVSYFHHSQGRRPPNGFEGTYSEFVDLFLEGKASSGSYFDYIKDWQKVEHDNPDLPVLTLYYEDLKKEPVKTVHKIADFLEKKINTELCEKISDACSFKKLQKADKELKDDLSFGNEPVWREGHVGMYRKGEVGDWKNWLTVAQNERFDEVIQREMKGTGITFTYE